MRLNFSLYFFPSGFLISTVCNEERNAIQLALGSFYPNLLLSGIYYRTVLVNNKNFLGNHVF